MAQNHITQGKVIPYVIPSSTTIVAGQGLLVGTIFGVALEGGTEGKTIQVQLDEVFAVKKKTTDAPAQGAKLYWDDTNKELTTTASTHTLAGIAYAAAINGATTVQILLNA